MGVSAPDIITYIGVPLAVLGVMPVLYTCVAALITQYRVHQKARENNLRVTTRAGLLAGVVEVDFPRYTIHTLPRETDAYWKQNDRPSSLKGGTWTVLNWQKIATGKISYRVQHSDELRQPQALIEMSDLMTFLLDRGASPSMHGLQLLRLMGLQTPPTTPLLLWDGKPVLTVSTPDESEGRLSLKLHWHEGIGGRSNDSLPPYWVRVLSKNIMVPEEGNSGVYPSVRVFLGERGLEDARLETLGARKSTSQLKEGAIDHLLLDPRLALDAQYGRPGLWFACATVAVCSQDQDGLFRFAVPGRVQTFVRRDTIPHGVLVLLEMRPEDDIPMWAERQRLKREAEHQAKHRELTALGRRHADLARMSPQERVQAQMEHGRQQMERMQDDMRQRELDALERKTEALGSQRVSNKVVAEAAFDWLKRKGHITVPDVEKSDDSDPESDLHALAAAIAHSMIFDVELATSVTTVLDSWIGWMDLIMNDVHLNILQQNQVAFCYAAILVNRLAEYQVNGRVHPVARDLDECQRVWSQVYLG